jgi:hypothetical protein
MFSFFPPVGAPVRSDRTDRFALRLAGAASGLAACLVGAAPAAAEEPAPEAPRIGLDELLKLPDSLRYDVDQKGGATRGEWRERFLSLRDALERERASLEKAKLELEETAGASDAWKLGLPGAGNASADAPLDYRLRHEIRQHEAEIGRLERRLRDLEVEANLAGVPADWRGATPEATTREPQPEPDPNPSDAAVPPEGDDP